MKTSGENGYRLGMRRRMRRRIFLVCLALALFGCWYEVEPWYRGHSLGRWLDTYNAILSGHLTEPGFEETRTALRHFGNKGLSCYTARLAYVTPTWQLSFVGWLEKAPLRLGKVSEKLSTFGREHFDLQNRRAHTAALAFEFLGRDAAPAIPDLERLAALSAHPAVTDRACEALKHLGPDGVLALARVVVNAEPGPSCRALRALEGMGAKAGPAQLLLAQTIGTNFSSDLDQFYKARLTVLDEDAGSSNSVIRVRALRFLAMYDKTLVFFYLLNHPDPSVRADATNVVREFVLNEPDWSSYADLVLFTNVTVRGYNSRQSFAPSRSRDRQPPTHWNQF